MPVGPGRNECAKQAIGLKDWAAEKQSCTSEVAKATEDAVCVKELKEKVEHYVLFSLYELEFMGEALRDEKKATLDDVVKLDVFVEGQKAKVEEAESVSEWLTIIDAAEQTFNQFKANVQ